MAIANTATSKKPGSGLAEYGFVEVPKGEKRQAITVSSVSRYKHGKTHFALTAPGPIAFINYDRGDKGVMSKFVDEGKKIYRIDVPKPILQATPRDLSKYKTKADREKAIDEFKKKQAEETRDLYEEVWYKGSSAYLAACEDESIKTVIVDTATEMYEAIRLARFGKLTQVMPQHYGPVKAEFRSIIMVPFDRNDLNVIWIHKDRKEYKENSKNESSWTGKMELAGFEEIPFVSEVSIQHLRRPLDGSMDFGIRITDNRLNPDLMGTELWASEGTCDFETLSALCLG